MSYKAYIVWFDLANKLDSILYKCVGSWIDGVYRLYIIVYYSIYDSLYN